MKTKLHLLFIALAFAAGIHSTLAQVTNLGIEPAGNQTVLFWPVTFPKNYVLQSTTNLASTNWVTVTDAIPVTAVAVSNVSPASFFRLFQFTASDGTILIPAGAFTMGDALDGESDAAPTVSVTVSAFYMDTNLVSYSQWQSVYSYATDQGYGFYHAGSGKAANHPVQQLNWFDCLKWCNARSQQAGLTPVYYTDDGFANVLTNGGIGIPIYMNITNNGYRLPTEAEWEKAARGGLIGKRFPWGNTISESQANYIGSTGGYTYDFGPDGYNSIGNVGAFPYTTPVGSFAPNGYGLYDMAGNVYEWCWDWYDSGTPYAGGNDPQGPLSGFGHVVRGGHWFSSADGVRCAFRDYFPPLGFNNDLGFRCVRSQ